MVVPFIFFCMKGCVEDRKTVNRTKAFIFLGCVQLHHIGFAGIKQETLHEACAPCYLHLNNKDTPLLIGTFDINNGVFEPWNTGNLFILKVFQYAQSYRLLEGEECC